MEQNNGVSKRPADDDAASVEWLDVFKREKRLRRSMRHCYAAVASNTKRRHAPARLAAATTNETMPQPEHNGSVAAYQDPAVQFPANAEKGVYSGERSHRDLLLSGIFSVPPEVDGETDGADREQPELMVTCPESRSAPFALVVSSVYALALHVCFIASSWWLVHEYLVAQARVQAGVTLFLAQLSSLPLFVVSVWRLVSREPSSACVLLLVLHALAGGLFNMIPLLQLFFRLVDSVVLYRTRGQQHQAALLKRQDVSTFTNVMWVITLSCFPQAVFQSAQMFEAALQEHAYTMRAPWLQAANVATAVLLTVFGCLKFNNRHRALTFTAPTVQSALMTAAEHAAWLPLLSARVLAFAILISKALEPTHVFAIFFALSLHFEFRRGRASSGIQQQQQQPRSFLMNVVTNVARATVAMFFKLRDWESPLTAKPYVVFAVMLFVQSFGCIFLPFLQQYGASMSMAAFRAYYAIPVFIACIAVHYALLLLGSVCLAVWYKLEGTGNSSYVAI